MTLPFTLEANGLSTTEAALRVRLYHLRKFGPMDLTDKERQQADDATRFETQLVDGQRVISIDRRHTRRSRS